MASRRGWIGGSSAAPRWTVTPVSRRRRCRRPNVAPAPEDRRCARRLHPLAFPLRGMSNRRRYCLGAGRSRTGGRDPGSSRRQSNPQRRKAGERNVSHSGCNIPAKPQPSASGSGHGRARKRRMARPAGGNQSNGGIGRHGGSLRPWTAPGAPAARQRTAVRPRLRGEGPVRRRRQHHDLRQSRTGRARHAAASATAPVVTALLQAGARLVGKTKTVELAYGLTGENVWQGTPVNPRAPDRFPGGSSCGSAAAVAAGLVDFALGSDTGGSVRIPASYCGLFGIRPSHGAVSLAGACPLAPSFDTCGWFTRSAALLAGRGRGAAARRPPGGGRPAAAGRGGLGQRAAGGGRSAAPGAGAARAVARQGGRHSAWPPRGSTASSITSARCRRRRSGPCLGGWVETVKPRFGPGIGERFAAAKATDAAVAGAGPGLPARAAGARPAAAGRRRRAGLSDQPLPRAAARPPAWPSRTRSGRRPWASRRSPGSADCRR